MKFFLAAVVFVVLTTTGSHALKCYNCRGKNVDTCRLGSATCLPPTGVKEGDLRCGRVVGYTGDGTLYGVIEECVIKAVCDQPEAVCKAAKQAYPEVKTCKTSCCSDDNCIGPISDSPKTSQVMFGVLLFGVVTAMLLN